ncbi:MAG TPA: nucleoside deaminase [Candidatus Saccharimonadales bacterium]|nr:nucleoside deaminase [Candidatus Saccharimonadales bacterium]
MTDEDFMRQAIQLAHESREKYKHAIGALLVKDGEVVASSLSHGHNFHAELNCIHAAFKELSTEELTGCTLYATQEPCTMCFGAALYANIERVVFGAYAADLNQTNNYEYPDFSLERLTKGAIRFDGGSTELAGGVLREECKNLMADHTYWTAPN